MPEQFDIKPDRQDVGSVLRDGRERLGYTSSDVAKQLHLDESVIDALETNKPNELPSAFVKGYLRSYAKLIELDGEALVKQFNRTSGTDDPEIGPVTGLRSQFSAGDPVMRWMSAGIIVVLAVMVGVWWQTNNGDSGTVEVTAETASPAQSGSAPVQPAPEPAPEITQTAEQQPAEAENATPVDAAAQPVVEVEPEPAGEAPTTASADEPVPASVTSVGARGGETPVVEADVADPLDTGTTATPIPVDESTSPQPADSMAFTEAGTTQPEPVSAPSTQPAVVDQAPAAAAIGTDVLTVIAREPSWVEVTDANGARLYYALHSSDDLRLIGEAPFVVFLGNSPDVEIRLNGVPYDQSAFDRLNNTARFMISADGLRRP